MVPPVCRLETSWFNYTILSECWQLRITVCTSGVVQDYDAKIVQIHHFLALFIIIWYHNKQRRQVLQ